MKKIFLMLIFILSLILSLVGCDNTYYWEFNYSYEEVDQIKIIEMIDDLDYREIQEIDLSLSKEFYNDIVMKFNNKVEMFPSNIVANMFKFEQAAFFEVKNEAEREAPKVQF